MITDLLTVDKLREWFDYSPSTGLLTRRVTRSNRSVAGSVAGTNSIGYVALKIDGRRYLAHRLAWLHTYGVWPSKNLDHINGVRSDNRIANLREATQAENLQNPSIRSNNTSGHTGVDWSSSMNKWRARIKVGRRDINLGYFKELEDAVAARAEGKKKYHTFNPQDRST